MITAGAVSVVALCAAAKVKTSGMFSIGEIVNILAIGVILLSVPIVNYRCKKKFP